MLKLFIKTTLVSTFCCINLALAQDPAAALPLRPSIGEMLVQMIPMMIMIFSIFYFMVIRPQQQKLAAQGNMLASLKKGDSVLTTGGLIAKVASLESDHIALDIASNVKVKFDKAHIVKKLD